MVAPPKEKKRRVPLAIKNEEKLPRMNMALLQKKIEDLTDVVYAIEQRIGEEHMYRKSLQQDLSALNHFVIKSRK